MSGELHRVPCVGLLCAGAEDVNVRDAGFVQQILKAFRVAFADRALTGEHACDRVRPHALFGPARCIVCVVDRADDDVMSLQCPVEITERSGFGHFLDPAVEPCADSIVYRFARRVAVIIGIDVGHGRYAFVVRGKCVIDADPVILRIGVYEAAERLRQLIIGQIVLSQTVNACLESGCLRSKVGFVIRTVDKGLEPFADRVE